MACFLKKFFFPFVFFIVFYISAAEKAEDFSLSRKVTDGTLNFSTFELTITGSGIPETNVTNLNSARITAEKAAAANTRLKTIKILSDLTLFGKTTVGTYFSGKGTPDFVEKLVNTADFKDVTNERFYSNSSVDVTYKVNISGYLRKIVEAAREEFSNKNESSAASEDEAAKTKSVLVITFKTKVEPQLLFSIVNEKGEKIYDISMSKESRKSPVSLFFAKKKADSLIEKEKLSGEVLSVQALKTNGGEIVIKNSDAEKIISEMKKECFEEGKIAAVSAE
ncbi:hypothetical protein J5690_07840 [bacterium]|nr:hypothetical protein [bacterium]